MAIACDMSNKEFNKLMTQDLCDNDRRILKKALDVLIVTVLKMQPDYHWSKRRIIYDNPYVVATNDTINMALVERGTKSPNLKVQRLLRNGAYPYRSGSSPTITATGAITSPTPPPRLDAFAAAHGFGGDMNRRRHLA